MSLTQRSIVLVSFALFGLVALPATRAAAQTLELGAKPRASSVAPEHPQRVFTLKLDQASRIRIETQGATKMTLRLETAAGAVIDLSQRKGKLTTPDLVNAILECDLDAGEYRVVVRHVDKRAAGEFEILGRVLKVLSAPVAPEPDPTPSEPPATLRIQAGHTVAVRCSAFAQNAGLALTGAADASILWHLPSGRELRRFPAADACDLSKGGDFVALASEKSIGVYDGRTGKTIFDGPLKQERPWFVAVLSEGDPNAKAKFVFLTSNGADDAATKAYLVECDVDGGNAQMSQPPMPRSNSFFVETKHRKLWLGGADGMVRTLDASGNIVDAFKAGEAPLIAFAARSDDASAYWVEQGRSQLMHKRAEQQPIPLIPNLKDTRQKRRPRQVKGDIRAFTPDLELYDYLFSDDSGFLFVSDSDGYVIRWSLSDRAPTKVFQRSAVDVNPVLAVSSDDASLLVGNGVHELPSVDVVAAAPADAMRLQFTRKRGPVLPVYTKAAPPLESDFQLAVADASSVAEAAATSWFTAEDDVEDQTPLVELAGSAATQTLDVFFGEDGRKLYAVLDDETLREWDLESGGQTTVANVRTVGRFARVDGRRYLLGEYGKVILFDGNMRVRKFTVVDEPGLRMQAQNAVSEGLPLLSYDAKAGVGCAAVKNTLVVFDPEQDEPLAHMEHDKPLTNLLVAENGKTILTADETGDVFRVSVTEKAIIKPAVANINESIQQLALWDEAKSDFIAVTASGRILIVRSGREVVEIPTLFATSEAKSRPVRNVVAARVPETEQLLVAGEFGKARILDIAQPNAEPIVLAVGDAPIRDVALSFNNRRRLAVFALSNKKCAVWDFNARPAKELCRFVSIQPSGYFAFDEENRFDTDNLEETAGVHWIFKSTPFQPGSPALFQREYYEPSLVSRKVSNDVFSPVVSISELDRVQPLVEIAQFRRSRSGKPYLIDVGVSVRPGNLDEHSGLPYDLRLFRNGQMVGQYPEPGDEEDAARVATLNSEKGGWRKAYDVLSNYKEDSKEWESDPERPGWIIKWFRDVRLPLRNSGKQIEFTAYAFNQDRVRSEISRVDFTVPSDLGKPEPKAYIISVGVNAYETPEWDLRYAVNDAVQFQRVIRDSLQDYEVVSIPLISDYRERDPDRLTERRLSQVTATKDNLRMILAALAGDETVHNSLFVGESSELRKATPDDLVMFFLAGHGFTNPSGEFYFFPYDIGINQPDRPTAEVLANAISSDELSRWMRSIDAGRSVMIIDACQSAGIAPAGMKFGPFGSRGLGQLAYDKGMQVLVASQSNEVAVELPDLKHGLMTYALLFKGITERAQDAVLTLEDALTFARDNVSQLFADLLAQTSDDDGRAKIVFGAENRSLADLTDIERGDVENGVQQPALFDFYRGDLEVLLRPPNPSP